MKINDNALEVVMIAYIPRELWVEGKPNEYVWVTKDPYERFRFAAVCRAAKIPHTINTNKNNVGRSEYKKTYKEKSNVNVFSKLADWLSR